MFSGIFKTCLTPKNKWELFLFMIYISLYGSKEYDDGTLAFRNHFFVLGSEKHTFKKFTKI